MSDLVDFDAEAAPTFRLRGRQSEWLEQIKTDLHKWSRLLCVAPGGVGKTGVIGQLAKYFWINHGIRTLVLENRDRLTEQTAKRLRDETGLDVDVEKGDQRASPYAPLVVGCVQSLSKVARLTGFIDTHFGLVIPDECFPSTVRVDGRPINEIKVGDLIRTFNHGKQCIELRRVRATSETIPRSLVELNFKKGRRIVCTANHPFFTRRGYVRAIDVEISDEIAIDGKGVREVRNKSDEGRAFYWKTEADMRELQEGEESRYSRSSHWSLQTMREGSGVHGGESINGKSPGYQGESRILLSGVQGCMEQDTQKDSGRINGGREKKRIAEDAGKQSDVQPCHARENEGVYEGEDILEPRGKWIFNGPPEGAVEGAWRSTDGVCDTNCIGAGKIPVAAAVLQSRRGHSRFQVGDRGGWRKSQDSEMEILGSKEDGDIEFLGVESIKILEQGSARGYGDVCPGGRVYNLEVEGNNNYFADGFLVHNCHLALSDSWLRVIRYFHWGADSLNPEWKQPKDGEYQPHCRVVGFTASPDLGTKKSLGDLFQHQSVNYSFLEAIEEGWLVGIKEINVPVRIDTRRFHRRQTAEGAAFAVADQNTALIPIIKELAQQIVTYAKDAKGICFVPSLAVARLMAEALTLMGVDATFVSGECIDKNEKTDAFAAKKSAWLINACLYNYGVDFPDVNCIAIFGAMISKVKYIQSIYRGTRVLPGILHDGMTQAERLAAIAASSKKFLLVLSPFYISDSIDICEPFDLFGARPEESKKVRKLTDMTDPAKIRDYIKALEKAADKHAHKQARTIDPVRFALSVGDGSLANYIPENAAEAAPPTREELDYLLDKGISTVDVKNSGQAQKLIGRIRERDRLGLASPAQLNFLRKLTKRDETGKVVPLYDEDWIVTIKKNQAGALMGKQMTKWSR